MDILWAIAALLAALLLLAILLSPKQEEPPSVLPPADTLPDKPIPIEHEHSAEEDTTCET